VFFAVEERVGEAPRYLVSDVPFDSGLDEVGTERLAQVVYLSAMALWAGEVESSRRDFEARLLDQHGAVVEPLPAPASVHAAPAAATREASRRTRAIVGYEYAVTFEGPAGVAQTLFGTVSVVREERALEIGGRIRVGALLPRQPESSGVELDLRGLTFGVGVVAGGKAASRAWIPAELGARVDALRYGTGALADPALRPTAGGLDVEPVLYGRLGIGVELPPVRVGIDALLDAHLLHTHYDISMGGHRAAFLVPWMVQPGVAAVVSW
jgi:hypothetical protein